mgnify:CR=1 FL=1
MSDKDNELTIEEVNGEILPQSLDDDMCYGPTYVAQCGDTHATWHGCASPRYACYIDCIDGGSLLTTAE